MIVDKLENINLYKHLSNDIYQGLKFITSARPNIDTGTYNISENVQAIVSEYKTVAIFERGYETHKHVIDIQYPIIGRERVKWSPISEMIINIPFDPIKDRTFYKSPTQDTYIDIGNGIFAIMFPDDGHSPQHFLSKPELIKKITIKVAIKKNI
jgi:YhcH/YjgK/YiaL family protein